MLAVTDEVSLDDALAFLEWGVVSKRMPWLREHLAHFGRTGDALRDGYRLLYEDCLGLSVPKEGEIVARADREVVIRWWNLCPMSEACARLGLGTRVIGHRVCRRPVQKKLMGLNSRLRFERNYEALRPFVPYCEERIVLDDD